MNTSQPNLRHLLFILSSWVIHDCRKLAFETSHDSMFLKYESSNADKNPLYKGKSF